MSAVGYKRTFQDDRFSSWRARRHVFGASGSISLGLGAGATFWSVDRMDLSHSSRAGSSQSYATFGGVESDRLCEIQKAFGSWKNVASDNCLPRTANDCLLDIGAAGRGAGRSRCSRRRPHRRNSRRQPWRCHRCFGWSRYGHTYCEPRSARPRSSLLVAWQLLLPWPQRQMVPRLASILPVTC
jgi:hypothetical protein